MLRIILTFILLSKLCVAQDASVFRLNLINPGLEYEHAISTQQKLIVNAGWLGYNHPQYSLRSHKCL